MDNAIIVTGASSGLGLELVKQLAASGQNVIAVARASDRLTVLVALENVEISPLDLSKIDTLAAWAAQIKVAHGPLAGVIHNAGIQVDKAFIETTDKEITRELDINLTAPIILTNHLISHMKIGSRLVYIGSILGFAPKRVSATYSASKAGLHLFTAGIRLQHSELIVQDVMVPVLETAMTAHRDEKKMSAQKAAADIIKGMNTKSPTIWIGLAKVVRVLLRIAPGVAAKIIGK